MKEPIRIPTMVEYTLRDVGYQDHVTSFVQHCNFANFLSRTPTLGDFIPCKDGKPLEDPESTMMQGNGQVYYSASDEDFKEYEEAQAKVIFDGFEMFIDKKFPNIISLKHNGKYWDCFDTTKPFEWVRHKKIKTIEDLIPIALINETGQKIAGII